MLAQDTVLSKWFVRRLGRAVALQRCTQALLAVYCMPLFVGIALPRVGWRATLRFLALPPIATLPLAAATLLPTPESCGMRPDGEAAETTAVCQEAEDVDSEEEEMASLLAAACGAPRAAAAAPQPEPAQFTVRQALDTRALRLLLLLTAATTCTTGGITTHVSLICRDAGVSLSERACVCPDPPPPGPTRPDFRPAARAQWQRR